MIFSYNWLQKYFTKPLPVPEQLAELLTMHIAEVEGIEEKSVIAMQDTAIFQVRAKGAPLEFDISIPKKDVAIDVKILPDRGCYGYGHLYLAREINAFTDCGFIAPSINYENVVFDASESDDVSTQNVQTPLITVEDPLICSVFTARTYNNVNNTQVPTWMKSRLQAVGQRSISFVVDLTNYIMMDIGQPMHAFDADKIQGNISIRYAREGEKVTLLDGREVLLNPTILVIADESGPLDIAGIKGGKKAEVTEATTRIILTAGNFNAAYIRKTTQKVGIKNDSTKRYENGVTHERVFEAQELARQILGGKTDMTDIVGQIGFSPCSYGHMVVVGLNVSDISEAQKTCVITVPVSFISQKIGVELSTTEVQVILDKLGITTQISSGDTLIIYPPVYRQDLKIKEDIVEEVGRLHGYHILKGVRAQKDHDVEVLPSFYFANKIRATLVSEGFSEIYTHSLVETGDIPLANPLSADRSHMRNDLLGEMEHVLIKNIQHLDVLKPAHPSSEISSDTNSNTVFVSEVPQDIRVFEIGHTFKDGEEVWSFACGAAMKDGKKSAAQLEEILQVALQRISTVLDCDVSNFILTTVQKQIPPTGGLVPCVLHMVSINFQKVLKQVEVGVKSGHYPLSELGLDTCKMGQFAYIPMSEYPYIVRDIAVFVTGPQGRAQEVKGLIESLNDPLIVSIRQFDQFEKRIKEADGTIGGVEKTSYAFRLVFQSKTETLTEAVVQEKMDHILALMKQKEGWEVR